MRGVAAGSAVLLLVGVPLVAAADEVELTIDDPAVTESSGLARDTVAGLYWTVNDSGDTSRVVAVDPTGEVQGEVTYDAAVVDVEAVARTPDGLYVGDIGDNGGDREFITVYRLTMPTPGATSTYNAWDLRYADGEARDAEAIAVTPEGRLLVITKEQEAGVWAAPATPTGQGMNTLERIGDAPSWVTDATVLDDGRIVVRGYLSVSVLDPEDFSVVASAPLPLQPQGESLTQSLDGEALLVGSEGRRSQVLRVPVPEAVTEDVQNPSAPPTGSSSEPSGEVRPVDQTTEEPAPETEETEGDGAAGDRTGTFVAVGLAALLALVGGAVVFLVGRPRHDEDDDAAPDAPGPAPEGAATAAALPLVEGDVPAPARDPEEATTVSQQAVDADGEPVAADTPSTTEQAPPAAASPASAAEDEDYVLNGEAPGRVTWSEPEGAGVEMRPRRAHEHAEDLDWLYEER
ncbi:hypothetical protein SAMN04489747_2002 [Auraticoccus monumenti]|uniref:Uncharacterized protein n=1 Tax=Auraticoccus monumenti TaxID=675864 RepID=A0A1G6YGB4_9ACTN|nr:hypothetical protein SAMN04489747_2002 [Auraticoccus monumenti]